MLGGGAFGDHTHSYFGKVMTPCSQHSCLRTNPVGRICVLQATGEAECAPRVFSLGKRYNQYKISYNSERDPRFQTGQAAF